LCFYIFIGGSELLAVLHSVAAISRRQSARGCLTKGIVRKKVLITPGGLLTERTPVRQRRRDTEIKSEK
jgi:hypothetical protein